MTGILNSPLLEEDAIRVAIKAEISNRISKVIDEAVEEAKKDVESKIREELAGLVLKVMNFYSVERQGSTILIKVDASS